MLKCYKIKLKIFLLEIVVPMGLNIVEKKITLLNFILEVEINFFLYKLFNLIVTIVAIPQLMGFIVPHLNILLFFSNKVFLI